MVGSCSRLREDSFGVSCIRTPTLGTDFPQISQQVSKTCPPTTVPSPVEDFLVVFLFHPSEEIPLLLLHDSNSCSRILSTRICRLPRLSLQAAAVAASTDPIFVVILVLILLLLKLFLRFKENPRGLPLSLDRSRSNGIIAIIGGDSVHFWEIDPSMDDRKSLPISSSPSKLRSRIACPRQGNRCPVSRIPTVQGIFSFLLVTNLKPLRVEAVWVVVRQQQLEQAQEMLDTTRIRVLCPSLG